MDKDVIAGRNPVREVLKSKRPVNKVLLSAGITGRAAAEIRALARQRGVPVQEVKAGLLDSYAGKVNHQGVIALASSRDYVDVKDILAGVPEGRPSFVAVLDEINDPHNLGAILRAADAAGVDGVIVPKRRAASLTPAVSRASAGAVEYVPVARVPNIPRTIDYLKEQGLWVIGAHGDGEEVYWDVDLQGPLAVVIGGEGKGLGRLVREKCDILARLPMAGKVNSLNASVAAALIFYEAARQRRRGKHG